MRRLVILGASNESVLWDSSPIADQAPWCSYGSRGLLDFWVLEFEAISASSFDTSWLPLTFFYSLPESVAGVGDRRSCSAEEFCGLPHGEVGA